MATTYALNQVMPSGSDNPATPLEHIQNLLCGYKRYKDMSLKIMSEMSVLFAKAC